MKKQASSDDALHVNRGNIHIYKLQNAAYSFKHDFVELHVKIYLGDYEPILQLAKQYMQKIILTKVALVRKPTRVTFCMY